MAVVKWDAEDLRHSGIPCGLHFVDTGRDDAEVEEFVGEDVVEETPGGTPFVAEEGVVFGRVLGGWVLGGREG